MDPELRSSDRPHLRILVVEDEPIVRFLIAEVLRESGVNVIEACTADEALDVLLTGLPVDLVFTDHRMPGSMTGLQLVAEVRARWPSIPVVLTSGDYGGERIPEIAFVRKPYALETVARELIRQASIAKGSVGD